MRRELVLGLAAGLLSSSAYGETYVVEWTNTQDATAQARYWLDNAASGDTILLGPGTYDNLTIEGRTNVTLRSQFPSNPAVIAPTGDPTPGLYIGNPQNITVSDIVIDFTLPGTTLSYGINADKAGSSTFGNGLVLRNITIKQIGSLPGVTDHEIDGIHMSGVQNFVIEKSRFLNWGKEGSAIDIVGAHHGMVRNNYLQGPWNENGSGVQMKGGARNIVVRANRLNNAGNRAIAFGGLTDLDVFEPGIQFEAKDLIAEGNVIVDGMSPIAFVSSIGGEFRYNFSHDTDYWMGRLLRDGQEAPGFPTKVTGGKYINNRLVWEEGEISPYEFINTSGDNDYEGFVMAGNHWYNRTNPTNSTPWYPVGITETGATYGVNPNVDPDKIVPWNFGWGVWLVNASLTDDSVLLEGISDQTLYLAIPGEGAYVDLGLSMPLVGNWSYTLVNGQLMVPSMSDALLVDASLIPEPTLGAAAISAALLLTRPARIRKRQ